MSARTRSGSRATSPAARDLAHRRQQQQLRQGRARRADAAQLGRRAHAVPRVRPRLHGLLSSVTCHHAHRAPTCCAISSTCPHRLFEHWLTEPTGAKKHARHEATGEPIPDALVAHARRAQVQSRATRRCATPPRRWSMACIRWSPPRAGPSSPPARGARAHRAAARRGHEPPAARISSTCSGSSYAAATTSTCGPRVLDADGLTLAEAGDPPDPAVVQRLQQFIYSAGDLSASPTALASRGHGRSDAARKKGQGEQVRAARRTGKRASLARRGKARCRSACPVVVEGRRRRAAMSSGASRYRQLHAGMSAVSGQAAQAAQHLVAVEVGQPHVDQHKDPGATPRRARHACCRCPRCGCSGQRPRTISPTSIVDRVVLDVE